jgi:polysaccharide biosynthesis transport protein
MKNISLTTIYVRCLSILKRRGLPAGLVFGAVVGGTALYAWQKTPIYRIEGQVIYEQENKTLSLLGLASVAKSLNPVGGWGDADLTLETEKRIILSQPILQQTVKLFENSYPKQKVPDPQALKQALTVKSVPSTKIIHIAYDSPEPRLAQLVLNTGTDQLKRDCYTA